jgi:bidirectional [NiFe] hydrogenase diaphorase subunit
MSDTIRITVDGRPAEVPSGSLLLDALRGLGVEVPTLCHHRSLEPSGACRLCVVEITHPDWKGWSGLVTSCLYPVEPGLQVSTRSVRVQRTRRTLLEMYLAECPASEVVRAAARAEGVDTTPFSPKADADLCIRCGLCLRVCQDLGPAAIAALGRGTAKLVGPRPDLYGEDCTACGACAHICPTGHIINERHDGKLRIWNRDFDVPLCSVVAENCRGCGLCEEVCPLAIPRVIARRDGTFAAQIKPANCVGCGLCAGACPTGAIVQEGCTDTALWEPLLAKKDLRGRAVIFACSRSALDPGADVLVPVPCLGRVGVEHLLGALARGADGVLLLCRDQATCPYALGGALGEQRAQATAELAASCGLGDGRVRYRRPANGHAGPQRALVEFRQGLDRSPLREVAPLPPAAPAGLDRALALLAWLRGRPELTPILPAALVPCFGDLQADGEHLLYLGDLPDLERLLALVAPDWSLTSLLKDAADLLITKGIRARPVFSERELASRGARRLIVFAAGPRPADSHGLDVLTLEEIASVPPSPGVLGAAQEEPFRFRIGPTERRDLVARLRAAGAAPSCAGPYEAAQVALLRREGAWQEGLFGEPMLSLAEAAETSTGERDA